MVKEDLIPLVERVAGLREILKQKEGKKILASEELKKTFEYETLQKTIGDFGDTVCDLEDAEKELKSVALAFYEYTGEKKPVEKVEVKIYKRLEYDPLKIETWCRTLAPYLLILDKKTFEKKVDDFKKAGAPVEILEEAKCTIGTDLSMYLEGNPEYDPDFELTEQEEVKKGD